MTAKLQEQFAAYDWSCAHRTKIQMRHNDFDVLQHVNNAVYMEYLEMARVQMGYELFQAHNITRLPVETVVVRAEIDYAKEIRQGQQVVVLTLVERLGNTSWNLVSCILADEKPCAFARVIQVTVDQQMKPCPLPAVFFEFAQPIMAQRN